MTQLGLRVRPNDTQIPSLSHPFCLLIHRTLAHDRRQEHDEVHAQWIAMLCDARSEKSSEQGPGREEGIKG